MATYNSRETKSVRTFHRRVNWTRVLLTICIALSTPFIMGMVRYARETWAEKESVVDHRADMKDIKAELDRILDATCYGKPAARVCEKGPIP